MSEPVSRRSALRGLAISGCAAVAGFVVARVRTPTKGTGAAANAYGPAPTSGRFLAHVDQVPAGSGLILAKEKVVLVSGPANAIHAFSAVCTHQGCTVGSVNAKAIVCPCHDSEFDTQTGAVVSGPAPRPLAKIAVELRGPDVYTT